MYNSHNIKPTAFLLILNGHENIAGHSHGKILMFTLSYPLQQLPCPFLFIYIFFVSLFPFCFLKILVLANASHELFSPFVSFSTGLLQIKLWARPHFFFVHSAIRCKIERERKIQKCWKKKSGKVVRSVLSSAMHESKSVQKQHVKIELENRLLRRKISSFPLFLSIPLSFTFYLSLTHIHLHWNYEK